jgi:hypothetical protein
VGSATSKLALMISVFTVFSSLIMRFWGEHNNTSYIITKFLSFYKGFVGNFGVRDENLQIFFTFSYGRSHSTACAFADDFAHSLPCRKE